MPGSRCESHLRTRRFLHCAFVFSPTCNILSHDSHFWAICCSGAHCLRLRLLLPPRSIQSHSRPLVTKLVCCTTTRSIQRRVAHRACHCSQARERNSKVRTRKSAASQRQKNLANNESLQGRTRSRSVESPPHDICSISRKAYRGGKGGAPVICTPIPALVSLVRLAPGGATQLRHAHAHYRHSGECAEHFGQVLAKYPPQVSSRTASAMWGCFVHNVVNKRLHKPEFNCENIGDAYDCGM